MQSSFSCSGTENVHVVNKNPAGRAADNRGDFKIYGGKFFNAHQHQNKNPGAGWPKKHVLVVSKPGCNAKRLTSYARLPTKRQKNNKFD
jgi:hypothetical protein